MQPDGDHRLAASVVLHAPASTIASSDSFFAASMKPQVLIDDHLGVGEVVGVLGAAVGELREVALAVDRVLVAAECDEADFHAGPTEAGGRRVQRTTHTGRDRAK